MWKFKGKELNSIPEGAFGFIYEMIFVDGSKYIGKKNFYHFNLLPIMKNGKKRNGHVKFTKKKNGNKFVKKELVKKETDWRTYRGSSVECDKDVKEKKILEFAKDESELSYLEILWQFRKDVLRRKTYLNKNINGQWFKK